MKIRNNRITNKCRINLFSEFVEVQINIVAILISFSVAIITILVSADNKNIEQLKNAPSSDCKPINGNALSLFQVLLSNIAYNVIVEIIYLILLIAVVLINALLPVALLKYIIAVCVFFIMHILFILLESVAQMYLTFWNKNKKPRLTKKLSAANRKRQSCGRTYPFR